MYFFIHISYHLGKLHIFNSTYILAFSIIENNDRTLPLFVINLLFKKYVLSFQAGSDNMNSYTALFFNIKFTKRKIPFKTTVKCTNIIEPALFNNVV